MMRFKSYSEYFKSSHDDCLHSHVGASINEFKTSRQAIACFFNIIAIIKLSMAFNNI